MRKGSFLGTDQRCGIIERVVPQISIACRMREVTAQIRNPGRDRRCGLKVRPLRFARMIFRPGQPVPRLDLQARKGPTVNIFKNGLSTFYRY